MPRVKTPLSFAVFSQKCRIYSRTVTSSHHWDDVVQIAVHEDHDPADDVGHGCRFRIDCGGTDGSSRHDAGRRVIVHLDANIKGQGFDLFRERDRSGRLRLSLPRHLDDSFDSAAKDLPGRRLEGQFDPLPSHDVAMIDLTNLRDDQPSRGIDERNCWLQRERRKSLPWSQSHERDIAIRGCPYYCLLEIVLGLINFGAQPSDRCVHAIDF